MRKLFAFSILIFNFFSCDDGDIITTELEFDDTFYACGDLVIYKTKTDPNQSLSLQISNTNFTIAQMLETEADADNENLLVLVNDQFDQNDVNSSYSFKYRSYASSVDNLFHIDQMNSHDENFALYFKTREKAILAKGEDSNYINDYPKDLYIYNHLTKSSSPLISYEWFPTQAKYFLQEYDFPVFPDDFAYYLLKDDILIEKTFDIKESFNRINHEENFNKGEILSIVNNKKEATLFDLLIVNLTNKEVETGSVLSVYSKPTKIIDKDSGIESIIPSKEIAKLIVIKAEEDFSLTIVGKSMNEIKVGDTIR